MRVDSMKAQRTNRKLLIISLVSEDLRTIGSCYVYAAAKNRGIDVKLLYLNVESTLNESAFREFLDKNKFGVIGIGLTTREFNYTVRLTKTIKKLAPDAFLFWGGVHPTCEPEECLQHVGCISMGEGEECVVEIVNHYDDLDALKKIDGVGLKLDGDALFLNQAAYIENIDALPYPYYEFGDNYFILDAQEDHVRPLSLADYATYSRHGGDGYTLITSRSCPNNCAYCINSFYNKLYRNRGHNRFFRRRSVESTIAEIKYAREKIPTVQFINFLDDHFLVGNQWLEQFVEMYGAEVGLPFIIRATPESITEARMKQLKAIGLKVVQMGIQSGCDDTHREIFHRHFKREKIVDAAKLLNHLEIEGLYDFIIGNEFESQEAKRATIELMMDLPKPYTANLFHIIPFPKTDIVDWYKEHDIKPKLDPYETNYKELEADFFTMLATLVPTTDNYTIKRFLDEMGSETCQTEVKRRYDKMMKNI